MDGSWAENARARWCCRRLPVLGERVRADLLVAWIANRRDRGDRVSRRSLATPGARAGRRTGAADIWEQAGLRASAVSRRKRPPARRPTAWCAARLNCLRRRWICRQKRPCDATSSSRRLARPRAAPALERVPAAEVHAKAPRVVPTATAGKPGSSHPTCRRRRSASTRRRDAPTTGALDGCHVRRGKREISRRRPPAGDGCRRRGREVLYGSARMLSHFFSDPDPAFPLAGVQAYNRGSPTPSCAWHRAVDRSRRDAGARRGRVRRRAERCWHSASRRVLLTLPSVGSPSAPRTTPSGMHAGARRRRALHVRVMRQVTKRAEGRAGRHAAGPRRHGAQAFLTDLPRSSPGVHDRFPRLTWVAEETARDGFRTSWSRRRPLVAQPRVAANRLRHEPSSTSVAMARDVHIDHVAVRNRDAIGVGNLMWSTDYPHHGCDWPASRRS